MTGFEPWTSGIGSDCSTNWATTTARGWKLWRIQSECCELANCKFALHFLFYSIEPRSSSEVLLKIIVELYFKQFQIAIRELFDHEEWVVCWLGASMRSPNRKYDIRAPAIREVFPARISPKEDAKEIIAWSPDEDTNLFFQIKISRTRPALNGKADCWLGNHKSHICLLR